MVLDLYSKTDCKTVHHIRVDAALVSPDTMNYRLAIKVDDTFRVSGLAVDAPCLYHCRLDDVVYWSWLSGDVIALVTDRQVFHWHLSEGFSTPHRVFARECGAPSEITAYKCDANMNWFALCSLQPFTDCIQGFVQLYSGLNECLQRISAHAVIFTNYRFAGNPHESTVLCLSGRDFKSNIGKIDIVELEPHRKGNYALSTRFDTFKLTTFTNQGLYDFPLTIQCSTKLGLVYMITKYGDAFVFDMENASPLIASQRVSNSIVFAAALNSSTEGLLFINRDGQIVSVDIKVKGSGNGETSPRSAALLRLESLLS